MAALRANIAANYVGQIWMAAMGLVFLPFYIHILGAEAFGLVGLLLSFQSMLQLVDFGIGGAINRELARRIHKLGLVDTTRNLVRSSEAIIWGIALLVAVAFWAASGLLAHHWLHLDTLAAAHAQQALVIMGIAIALLWPSTFYANCLYGLERQSWLNGIYVVFSTLRFAGVVPVLLWVSPGITTFLWWYAIIGAGQSLVTAFAVWHALPAGSGPARWSAMELRSIRGFAGGLFLIAVLAMGVTQVDRLTLASLRPLEELGYYTLAVAVAGGLGRMVQPMFNAIYPRFSRLVAQNDTATLCRLYHLASQCLAVVVAAVACVLIVFAPDVLRLWTGDAQLAHKVAAPMTILVAGAALNGLVNIPYALQLAHGWTRLAMGLNAVSLILGIPFCIWAVHNYGTTGAALLWLGANALSIAVGVPLMHRRLLQGELWRWGLRDNLPSIVAAAVVALALSTIAPPLTRSTAGFAWLVAISCLTLLFSAAASYEVRRVVGSYLRRMS